MPHSKWRHPVARGFASVLQGSGPFRGRFGTYRTEIVQTVNDAATIDDLPPLAAPRVFDPDRLHDSCHRAHRQAGAGARTIQRQTQARDRIRLASLIFSMVALRSPWRGDGPHNCSAHTKACRNVADSPYQEIGPTVENGAVMEDGSLQSELCQKCGSCGSGWTAPYGSYAVSERSVNTTG